MQHFLFDAAKVVLNFEVAKTEIETLRKSQFSQRQYGFYSPT